ncbi:MULTISPECIES: transposase [unclassified Bradyrhizobium]|uniref:transposase n=1 Tax=unclassified Bradyrhizobium TaxID=2631580 RepID=UPI001FFEB5B0|nr:MULTISPECIES: transposase [unclassified Bradyrhizobium]
MLVLGYVFALRSERRLCAEVQVNLAYRWFCKLGIEDHIPDHSVFCRARRERFRESDALRRVFERGAVYFGGAGRRRSVLSRCEPDQGRCEQD